MRQGGTRNPQHALNSAHAGTFIIGIDDSLPVGLRVRHSRIEDAAATTILTTVLLFAFGVVSVLDNVLALAMGTVLGGLGAYHSTLNSTLSFEI